jgi:prevent-host-death family protein
MQTCRHSIDEKESSLLASMLRRTKVRVADARSEKQNLISMTRLAKVRRRRGNPRSSAAQADRWALQDAKTHFSELVRCVKERGPQHVTVHGQDEVVVIAADEFRKLYPARSGGELLAALQACPHPEELREPHSLQGPVRKVVKL